MFPFAARHREKRVKKKYFLPFSRGGGAQRPPAQPKRRLRLRLKPSAADHGATGATDRRGFPLKKKDTTPTPLLVNRGGENCLNIRMNIIFTYTILSIRFF